MANSGVKFKDTLAAYDRLRGEIAGRKFAPVYLLMGEEAFFIDALCDLLASTILQESERAFNQLTVYGRDSDAGQVVNLCRQMPMMGSYQVVILKEAQQLRGLDKLSLYTSKPSPTTILIVCHKEKNVDKRSQLYKSIAQHGAVLESVRPRDYEIGPWLAQFVASKGCTIDAKAQAMLTDHLGTDLAKISNELGKLLLSLPEGTKKITDAHIEQNIGISKDFNNFELCKAVTGQNLEQALRIADHFARNPKDNPLLVTILALFNQFREIFRINYLRWLSRHKGVPFPSDTELIGILRMNNAYALGELKQTSARWDNRRVFRILGLLREYDAKSKGMNAGGAPDGELLRELLLKIFLQYWNASCCATVSRSRCPASKAHTSIRRFMSGDAAPSGSTATRNCWLAIYKSFSGCAGPPTFADWRHRSPLCSTPTVTPSQALRSYAWPSHRRATCC